MITFLCFQGAAVLSSAVAMAKWFRRRWRAVLATLLFWTFVEVTGILSAVWLADRPPPVLPYMSAHHAVSRMSFDIALASETVDQEVLNRVWQWTVGYGLASLALLTVAIARIDRSISRPRLSIDCPALQAETGYTTWAR
jgi:hypothetical protein